MTVTWNRAVEIATDTIRYSKLNPNRDTQCAPGLSARRIGNSDHYAVNWVGKTVADLTEDEAISLIASILTPEEDRPL